MEKINMSHKSHMGNISWLPWQPLFPRNQIGVHNMITHIAFLKNIIGFIDLIHIFVVKTCNINNTWLFSVYPKLFSRPGWLAKFYDIMSAVLEKISGRKGLRGLRTWFKKYPSFRSATFHYLSQNGEKPLNGLKTKMD